jgi:isopentenyl-diphosphate Delta-isomerase
MMEESDSTNGLEELIPAWVEGRLRPVEKLEVHRSGLRHKAVSVFANCGDLTLLQKRAAGKYHTPGLWSNACCTHPRWGEDAADTAHRRLREELGLVAPSLRHCGQVVYRADVGNGLVEHEEVEMFSTELPNTDLPPHDPAEVAATRWVSYPELEAAIAAEPANYSPWLQIYLTQHRDLILAAG